jgi:hypothetical protein
MRKNSPILEYCALHKYEKLLDGRYLGKTEVFVLMQMDMFGMNFKKLREVIRSLPEYTLKDLSTLSNPDAILPLLATRIKLSTDTFTEAEKRIVKFNNAPYLIRAYKFVDKPWIKVEITKVNQGTRKYGAPSKQKVRGMVNMLERVLKGNEKHLLGLWCHSDDFTPVKGFLDA